jgi:hypothetical protein
MAFFSCTIPRADFAYATNLAFMFEGDTYITKIAVSRPVSGDAKYVWEFHPLTSSPMHLYMAGKCYPMLGYIPYYEYIHPERSYDKERLAQDLKACGFDAQNSPELQKHLDVHELGEMEKALELNRTGAKETKPWWTPHGVNRASVNAATPTPKSTPFAPSDGVRAGEIKIVIANARCGTSTFPEMVWTLIGYWKIV